MLYNKSFFSLDNQTIGLRLWDFGTMGLSVSDNWRGETIIDYRTKESNYRTINNRTQEKIIDA